LPDIASLLADGFTEETARLLYAQGEEIAIFVMMQLAALAVKTTPVSGVHPSEPSGSVAVFLKEPRKKRRKKPGAKPGHKGSHRPPPENMTRHVTHVATCCPDCGGKLNRRRGTTRKRYTRNVFRMGWEALCQPGSDQRERKNTGPIRKRYEDIPDDIKPEITEHTIQQDYCPMCRKVVEPVVPDAMPGATIGHRTVVLSAFLHYFVGTTISQIITIFNMQFFFKLTAGGLMNQWHRLAAVLKSWYDEIGEMVKTSGVLHADETGWRVNGKTLGFGRSRRDTRRIM